jgi:hypothetical protein
MSSSSLFRPIAINSLLVVKGKSSDFSGKHCYIVRAVDRLQDVIKLAFSENALEAACRARFTGERGRRCTLLPPVIENFQLFPR